VSKESVGESRGGHRGEKLYVTRAWWGQSRGSGGKWRGVIWKWQEVAREWWGATWQLWGVGVARE
jgi:hypothetical protein